MSAAISAATVLLLARVAEREPCLLRQGCKEVSPPSFDHRKSPSSNPVNIPTSQLWQCCIWQPGACCPTPSVIATAC
ncbi:hypothetical protein L195_g036707 [Trifolium pratense]|uniref:Secreted protein n=1 Tax=Trifolium pratense TaxID=57577 RepID=A0A2K3LQ84_TRIPR|nr:hypothetical protein L195_g036707 [Trifolium pratense]